MVGTGRHIIAEYVSSTLCQSMRSLRELKEADAARFSRDREGIRGLATGFGSTAVGYFLQGGAKFAGYEFFKKKLTEASGSYENAVKNRTAIYLGGAACVLSFPFFIFFFAGVQSKNH